MRFGSACKHMYYLAACYHLLVTETTNLPRHQVTIGNAVTLDTCDSDVEVVSDGRLPIPSQQSTYPVPQPHLLNGSGHLIPHTPRPPSLGLDITSHNPPCNASSAGYRNEAHRSVATAQRSALSALQRAELILRSAKVRIQMVERI